MKASNLLVGLVAVSFLASSVGAQIPVTDGLVSSHVANVGWDGTNWADQVLGDGYDPTGNIIGDVTHVPGGIPHFQIGTTGPGSNDQIGFDVSPNAFIGATDFTYQLVIKNSAENAYFDTHTGIVGAGTGVGKVSDTCCDTEGIGFWLVRTGDRDGAASHLRAFVRHWNVKPRTPTYQAVTSGNMTTGPNGDLEVPHDLFNDEWRLLTVVRAAQEIRMYFDGEDVSQYEHEATSYPPPRQGAVDLTIGREDIVDSTLNIGGHGYKHDGDGLPGAQIHAALFYNRALSLEEIALNAAYFPVPEPASLALLTVGGLLMLKRRRL